MSIYRRTKQQKNQAVPETSDRVTALAALYQGEKTDASSVFNAAMAMMAAAVAYLVGAIPFVGDLSGKPSGWLFLLLLPMPLWLIAAFHSLMTLNAMSHGISVRIIEDALFEESRLRVNRLLIGSAAGDKIMDFTQEKVVHKITTLVVYGGILFLVCVFTVYSLYSAKEVIEKQAVLIDVPIVRIAIVIYSLLAIMVVVSWIVGVLMIVKGRSEIPSEVRNPFQS